MTTILIFVVLLAFIAQISFIGGGNLQPRDVLPDPVLSRMSLEFGEGGPYAHDIIAPQSVLETDSFKFSIWEREELQAFWKALRTPGAPAAYIDFAKTFTPGVVEYYSLNNRIPDEVRGNDPDSTGLENRRSKILTTNLRMGIEQRIFDIINLVATRTVAAPAIKWGTHATAIPIGDILRAKNQFRLNCGYLPTHIVIPPAVMQELKQITNVVELVKHTHSDLLAKGTISDGDVIEGMIVVEPGGVTDSANPGAAASIGDIWNLDEVYLLYVDPTAGSDLAAPTALRQVRSTAAGASPFAVTKWRDPDVSAKSDVVTVENNQTEVLMSIELVITLLDVLA